MYNLVYKLKIPMIDWSIDGLYFPLPMVIGKSRLIFRHVNIIAFYYSLLATGFNLQTSNYLVWKFDLRFFRFYCQVGSSDVRSVRCRIVKLGQAISNIKQFHYTNKRYIFPKLIPDLLLEQSW
uniref:Uncharacterized protein n=1 Tax=Cacopsylla melanoneura TaxID=428564 RepID=A0A8D8XNA5_9HEMI